MTGALCGQITGNNVPIFLAIYLALLLFGIAYNWLTAWAEKTGFIKGYTSLFVVGGVAVTVAATAVISLAFALITAGAFIASGTPMIVGSMIRHKREELHQLEQAREEARHGNPPQTLANGM
jgi:predicted tellurium resistance membrane protein TerC